MELLWSFTGRVTGGGARYHYNWNKWNPKSPNAWWKGTAGKPIWGSWKKSGMKSPSQVAKEFSKRKQNLETAAAKEAYRVTRAYTNLTPAQARALVALIGGTAVWVVSQSRSSNVDRLVGVAIDEITGRTGRFLPYKDKAKNKQYLRVAVKKYMRKEGWL